MITLDELLYGQACSSIAPEDIRIMIESRFDDLKSEYHADAQKEIDDLSREVDELADVCSERLEELTAERTRHKTTQDKVREARKILESIA